MKPKYWGVIAFLLMMALAAAPAHSDEAYVASADRDGNAVYMVLIDKDNGVFSGPEDLLMVTESGIGGLGYSYGANGIGDFDGDGDMDYILALGYLDSFVYVIPKSPESGSGDQFGSPVHVATFSEGYYPSAMTVADFNGDKMLDFVVASYGSSNCWLFLNKGDGQPDVYEFEPVFLENTAPRVSFDMDAADVNNDGMADFIVGSKSASFPFKVNLWSGNDISDVPVPEFESHELRLDHPVTYLRKGFGIAVADFITSDEAGNADLAVANSNSLDLYQGDGSGSFTYLKSKNPFPLRSSPLDNGDFDGNGTQDLIAGNFGSDYGSVVVLFGDGAGNFTATVTAPPPVDIYTRDGLRARTAVTGPAFFESNKAPLAQLTPEVITVTVGETVQWDASGSYDEDGTIVRYEWDYGDGAVSPMGEELMDAPGTGAPESSYVYYDSGTYYVTLTVTDDKGASATVHSEVEVKPLGAVVRFSPRKLNLKSKGKWITATIQVPGRNAGMIDPASLFLELPDNKVAIQAHVSKRDRRYYKYYSEYNKYFKKKYHKKRKLKVKFDRQALIAAIGNATGPIGLTVSGDIDSLEFSGQGTIIAFEKKKKGAFQKDLWKQMMSWFSKGQSKHK
jgi:PKD repeat protein